MPSVRHGGKNSKSKAAKFLMLGVVLCALLTVELLFDVFEIAMGKVLLFTNPVRPKIGRLWEEDLKEQEGIEQLGATAEMEGKEARRPLRSLEDLQAVLSIRSSMTMTREEFKEFYKSIPIMQAKQMLDPLDLIALDRSAEWRTTQLSFTGNQLVMYFLDGYDQPIEQSHFVIANRERQLEEDGESSLDENSKFKDRIISAALFYQAFDRLPRSFRLQIVNDPYKLVRWGAGLRRVAISRSVEEDGVQVVFEVSDNAGLQHYNMFASPIAIEYLLNEIKKIDDAPELELPEERYESDEKDY